MEKTAAPRSLTILQWILTLASYGGVLFFLFVTFANFPPYLDEKGGLQVTQELSSQRLSEFSAAIGASANDSARQTSPKSPALSLQQFQTLSKVEISGPARAGAALDWIQWILKAATHALWLLLSFLSLNYVARLRRGLANSFFDIARVRRIGFVFVGLFVVSNVRDLVVNVIEKNSPVAETAVGAVDIALFLRLDYLLAAILVFSIVAILQQGKKLETELESFI